LSEALHFNPQLAVVANPAPKHIEISMKLASLGTHLLIEKPISSSLKQVSELIEICRKKDLVLAVGYNLRFLDSLLKLKDLVEADTIGNLLSIRVEAGENLTTWRPNRDYRETVSANKILGGGPLLELSHEIDYIRWIFGEFNWVSGNLSKSSELEIDTEDCVHAFFEIQNKQDNRKIVGILSLDFIRFDKQRTCTVIGERGTLHWDGVTGRVTEIMDLNRDGVKCYEYGRNLDATYELQWKDFLNCIEIGESPVVTGLDALRTLHVIEAIRQSSNLQIRQDVFHETS
jgi:predicted dehydrogenase